MIGGMVVMVPMMTGIFDRMNAFAAQHPDRVTVTSGPGQYHMQIDGPVPPELILGDMGWFFAFSAIVSLLAIVLLAAAVVRRLHDSGRGGWWGALPLPFLVIGLVAMFRIFDTMQRVAEPGFTPPVLPFVVLFANNMLYLGMLALLVVQLCRPSDPGVNRFGPPTG